MAVSGLSGGAWTLVVLVLVPLVMDLSWASPIPACTRWNEFDKHVQRLNETLTSCPQDCNSAQIIDRKCHCLNLITSGKCVVPYFISGLEAVNRTLPASSLPVQSLINKLSFTHQNCMDFDVPLTCHSSVSPQSFFNTMNHFKQYIHSKHVQRR